MLQRCFIGIFLPSSVLAGVADFLHDFQIKNPGCEITYVQERNVHLTLHFLGNIDELTMEMVQNMLRDIAREYIPFRLTFERLGGFPNLKNPHVLFLSGAGEILPAQKLQQKIGDRLQAFGLRLDRRPWVNHLTLSRVKRPVELKISTLRVHVVEFMADRMYLVKSILHPRGPEYIKVEEFRFGLL